MFEKIANIFRIPDLRKRVLFTLGMLAVYRLGGHIPTPGINADMLAQFFNQNSGSALGLVDLFSGGNLRKLTVFALGPLPTVTGIVSVCDFARTPSHEPRMPAACKVVLVGGSANTKGTVGDPPLNSSS